ncbi:MAG: indolepyruvate ferredoxin oxidoreductase, alpha subunit [Clostridia bacterium]|jgi:indolepyruvate ferredoxin oxidoreductase alpha subunit|uniref:indolepyruvate ferredoxin oxidoreductase subunit alpha n=1 Tax=Petroclostridium xylanilyticum TaxID=1792311 RepID=UPI000B98C314|nr:indolepyruvate ferredoxin oxidoreductase subunit alpha [Petroclostridium xylanilyticum]MBZ4645763.1 indolepyruvate ferredoxin oxidoreductase, alpha subunit [Clostridia bacterium]
MKKLMLGNEAIARGAYEAGVTVVSSYPGTPSTEITEAISKYDEIYSEWAPNEKVAMEVAIGASIGGARAMSAMKHVGLNVAADPLFTCSYTGVNGGLVFVVADDPGMHSSQNEQDSRHYAKASKVVMLEPSDSQECKDFTIKAYELSEKYDTPVIIRLSTRVSHSQSLVEISDRQNIPLKEYKKDFQKFVMMPAMARKRHVFVEERIKALKEYAENCELNKIEWGDKKIGVITSGIAYQYAREALGNVSYLKLGMVYPLPEKLIADFVSQVDQVYVIEELDPIFEEHCKKLGCKVIGKELLPILGELSTEIIKEKILGIKVENKIKPNEEIPVRPPVMCPGCPHRGMFYILKKLKLVVSGDIGCYTLGALPPLESMDTCICMGASVSAALGMEKARGKEFSKKLVAVIGDSTFIHSGITGLIDIVYNKGVSTVIILDNSITGMTGHQHNPTTGFTIKGEPTKQVDLVKLANAIGVERVRVVDPFDLDTFEKVVKEEVAAEEPSVIISQRPCALLKHVKFDGPLSINQDKCTSCKMCMRLGCPAISNQDGKIRIDITLCNGCGLCVKVCKFSAIEKAGDING